MLMTGIPRNTAASALEMTASTAIPMQRQAGLDRTSTGRADMLVAPGAPFTVSMGNRAATSLPVVKNDAKPGDLPASDIL
jgi:hypothetical protein